MRLGTLSDAGDPPLYRKWYGSPVFNRQKWFYLEAGRSVGGRATVELAHDGRSGVTTQMGLVSTSSGSAKFRLSRSKRPRAIAGTGLSTRQEITAN